jgi:geranylgeranylglycerol-phosphate geranylgeranyltransferase
LIEGIVFKRILATLEISRPHNMAAAAGCVVSAYYLTGGRGFGPVLLPALATALVTGLGNLVNDFFDAEIDAINKPRRPIPSGRLTRAYVFRVYTVGTALLTLFAVFYLPVPVMAVIIAWEILLFYYAFHAKRIPLTGNILVAAVCASAFVVGAMVTGAYKGVLFPAGFAFAIVFGRELIKGAEDVEGDTAAGATTLAVRFGGERVALWSAMVLLLCAVALPLPGLLRVYGRLYTLLVLFLIVPGLLAAAYLVLNRPNRQVFNRASWILKVTMLVGIVVFGLGRV